MNILLVYPVPSPKNTIMNYLRYQQGIGSISAMLKKYNHKTSLLYIHELNTNQIDQKISKFRPELIAISSTTNQINLSKKISVYIHKKYNLPVIIGGPHPTVAPEDVLNTEGIFGICIGEGEQATLELVNKLEQRRPYLKTKNFWFNYKNKIYKNSLRNLIENLDDLPFPDRELFDYQKVIDESHSVDIFAGRGCPYGCTNCINNCLLKLFKGKGSYVRLRSPENVIQEIENIIKRYKNVTYIQFQDETFTLNKKWLKEFCEKYKERVNVPFQADTRADIIDEESLGWLKNAGCDMLDIGIESGNDYIRNKILKRNISKEQIIKGCNLIKKYGIRLWAFNMIGLPYETPETIEETLKLNREIKPNTVFVSVFQPYPGTELYNLCKKNNWIKDLNLEGYFGNKTMLDQPGITKDQVAYYYNIFPWVILYPRLAPFVKVLAKIKVSKEKTIYDIMFPLIKTIYKFKYLVIDRYLKKIIKPNRL